MNFLDLCRKRRSIRSYSERKVPRDVVERCLEAARLAPSACNSQPWRFIVLDDDELRARVAKAAFTGIYTMNRFAEQAPLLVVVVTQRSKYFASMGAMFRGTRYALIDIGIAVEHFVLQAAEEGLATCWIGWLNERAVKKLLRLPRAAKVDIMLSIGYPADNVESRDKLRRSLDDIREYR